MSFIYKCVWIFISFTATCFRNAKAFPEAKDAFLKAADVHRQQNSYPYLMVQYYMHAS